MKSTGNWEVKKASLSPMNGGLYLEGFNHFEARPFFWHVREGLDHPEYDWSTCEFAPGARECGARVVHSFKAPRCNPFVSNADMEAQTG